MTPLIALLISFGVIAVIIAAIWIAIVMTDEEKDNGIHRGTDQEVHGSADPASSGDQSTGAFIAASPGHITWSSPGSTNAYSVGTGLTIGSSYSIAGAQGTSGLTYQQQLQQAQMQMQQAVQHNLYYGNTTSGSVTWSSVNLPTVWTTEDTPRKPIKNEGIRMGEIIAYRCWPIKNGFLWSTAAGRAWAPGEPMKAGEHHIRDGLGVYAFKDMSRVIQTVNNVAGSGGREGVAFGTILLWGEIVEHEIGYRAEYAAIKSIDFICGPDSWLPEHSKDLRKLYKVESNES